MDVLVVGGTGFIGRQVCAELADRDHFVTAGARSPDPTVLPDGVEAAVLDVTAGVSAETVAGYDVVVNLVALPSHVQPHGQSHDAVTHRGTASLVEACETADVTRFVLMSALGVESPVDTAYMRAKRRAEGVVRDSDLEWVIFRPSVVFGYGCAFLPFLRRLSAPRLTPLPRGGRMRIQPMWVGDLALMVADGVVEDRHASMVYRLGGPDVLTLADTVKQVRPSAIVVPIPMPIAALGAGLCEVLPWVPIGRDQYRVHRIDNTVADNDVRAFGMGEPDLTSLEAYLEGVPTPSDG